MKRVAIIIMAVFIAICCSDLYSQTVNRVVEFNNNINHRIEIHCKTVSEKAYEIREFNHPNSTSVLKELVFRFDEQGNLIQVQYSYENSSGGISNITSWRIYDWEYSDLKYIEKLVLVFQGKKPTSLADIAYSDYDQILKELKRITKK